MTTHFEVIPYEINRLIGSYLDYNSRMEFHRALTHVDDKFVRKLDSRSHAANMSIQRMNKYLHDIHNSNDINERVFIVINMFEYMYNMPYKDIFNNKKFREICIEKTTKYSETAPDELRDVPENLKEDLVKKSKILKEYVEKYVPNKKFEHPKLVQII